MLVHITQYHKDRYLTVSNTGGILVFAKGNIPLG